MKKITYFFLLLIACQILTARVIYARPRIRLSKANWDTGKVPEGRILKEELVIENSGNETLELKVRSSCDCIGISFTKKDIKPDKRVSLIVSYDTTGESGKKTDYLFLDSNDPQYPHLTWMIESDIALQNKETVRAVKKQKAQEIIFSKTSLAVTTIHLFSTPFCRYCLKLKERIIPGLEEKYGLKIQIKEYLLSEPENYEKLILWEEEYGDSNNKIPVIFIGGKILGGKKEIAGNLEKEIQRYEGDSELPETEENASGISEKYLSLKILPVLSAGLIDGLNPCAFGAIIFLISYLSVIMKRERKEIFLTGMSFAFGVYVAYFLLGAGLISILSSLKDFFLVSKILYFLIGMVTLLLAVISFKDYLALRKANTINKNGGLLSVSLKLPKSFLFKILEIIERHAKVKYFVIFAFVTGIIISGLELVCTGQIYLPTIIYMLKTAADRNRAIVYLLLYSLMFIVPLLLVFALFFWGARSEKIEIFGKRHYKTVKIFNTLIFFFFSVYMLAVALSIF